MGNDHYQLVTINDGKSDADAIIKVFSAMQDGRLKCDLSLLNYCNEVPVCYSATIATVEDDSVELSVHEHQALIMKQNNSTLIKSQHFGKGLGVHCYAAYVNVPKKPLSCTTSPMPRSGQIAGRRFGSRSPGLCR